MKIQTEWNLDSVKKGDLIKGTISVVIMNRDFNDF